MSDLVALQLKTPPVCVVVAFESRTSSELARRCVLDAVSGFGLPPVSWDSDLPSVLAADFSLSIVEDRGMLRVQFGGMVQTARYEVEASGFHWDFWDAFLAVAIPRLIEDNVLVIHAAAIAVESKVFVMAGQSGAGKSSIAYAALTEDTRVLASELCFLRDGVLLAGNCSLTADPSALRLFNLCPPRTAKTIAGRVVVTLPPFAPTPVSRLLFPRVADTPLRIREISDRRARMLLFENAITQHPICRLLAHETQPIGIAPSQDELAVIARQASSMATLAPAIVEGRPAEIAALLAER